MIIFPEWASPIPLLSGRFFQICELLTPIYPHSFDCFMRYSTSRFIMSKSDQINQQHIDLQEGKSKHG